MSGTAVGAGVVAAAGLLAVGLAVAGGAAAESQRIASVADAAALAAADTVSGVVPGDPCRRAETVASAGRASVGSCTVEGSIATVSVHSRYGGFPVAAAARAGPPPR